MLITTKIEIKNLEAENTFEMEYFHDDGIYQLRICGLKNNKWQTKEYINLKKIEAAWLLDFLQLSLKLDEL